MTGYVIIASVVGEHYKGRNIVAENVSSKIFSSHQEALNSKELQKKNKWARKTKKQMLKSCYIVYCDITIQEFQVIPPEQEEVDYWDDEFDSQYYFVLYADGHTERKKIEYIPYQKEQEVGFEQEQLPF